MTYYISETLKKGQKPKYFNSINEVITYLEDVCKRKHKLSRRDYMQSLAELGHPADESSGKNFVEAMAESVNIGIVRKDQLLQCNIISADYYSKYKTEMGD